MQTVGLSCPITHNPADFSMFSKNPLHPKLFSNNYLCLVIEVSCGEYGMEYIDRMVSAVENGKCYRWTPHLAIQNVLDENDGRSNVNVHEFEEDINPEHLKCRSSSWDQFKVLFNRRWKQMWRDSVCKSIKVLTFVLNNILFSVI